MQKPVRLPDALLPRMATTVARALRRRCPYCGGGSVFQSYYTIKERCPSCNTLYAYEDGYFLGSYVINLVLPGVFALILVILLIPYTDLSVLQIQIIGVALAIGLPVSFYPFAALLWVALDLTVNPPGDFSNRPRT